MEKYSHIKFIPINFQDFRKNFNTKTIDQLYFDNPKNLKNPETVYFKDCIKYHKYYNSFAITHRHYFLKIFYPFKNLKTVIMLKNEKEYKINWNQQKEIFLYRLNELLNIRKSYFEPFPFDKIKKQIENL